MIFNPGHKRFVDKISQSFFFYRFSLIFQTIAMASAPMISAPTLVTSTNPATVASTAASTSTRSEDWRSKYLEAKDNCRKLKSQMREQAKKSRQLILAVKTKLQDEENEKVKVKNPLVFCNELIIIFASLKNMMKRVS